MFFSFPHSSYNKFNICWVLLQAHLYLFDLLDWIKKLSFFFKCDELRKVLNGSVSQYEWFCLFI